VKLSRLQTFMLAVGLAIIILLVVAYSNATILIDWNEFVNGILRDTVAVALGTVMTIWVYRFLYHRRKSKG
jgi:uncharacterized BrkB/YihY/UPF0761 family membrane protein